MFNPRTSLSHGIVNELFERCNRNRQKLHVALCKLAQKDKNLVNASSLYTRVRTTSLHLKRLNKRYGVTQPFQEYRNNFFSFPIPRVTESITESSRHTLEINAFRKQAQHMQSIIKIKSDMLRQKSTIIKRLKTNVGRQEDTICRLKSKIIDNNTKRDIEYMEMKQHMKSQRKEMTNIIDHSKMEIDDLHCKFDGILDSNNNNTSDFLKFDTRESTQGCPYNTIVRSIYYFMRSHGVGIEHIQPIVKYIFESLKIKHDDLPCPSSALHFDKEMCVLARQQISDICKSTDNITMYRDATTKSGRHFYGVELSTVDKTYTLGLQEIADGCAETYSDTTRKIMNDVETLNKGDESLDILSKLKNFMTDRSATEEKTNRILKSDNQTNNFKCSVHPLLQFWEVCSKKITEIEKSEKLTYQETNGKECLTSALLNAVSKLFFKDGSGDPTLSSVYLQSQCILNNPIEKMRGSRLNVQFHNAGGIFCLRNIILDYLIQSKQSLNFNMQLIVDGLNNDTLMCVFQALGIISRTITGPYWQAACENKSPIEMGSVYRRLIDILEEIVETPSSLYENKIKLSLVSLEEIEADNNTDTDNNTNNVSFFKPNELRSKTEGFIAKFCAVILSKCKHLFKDYLQGGKFYEPSDELIASGKSCSSNNITVERLMAKLDSAILKAPNASIGAIETKILYNNNNTQSWLDGKEDNEKANAIKIALQSRKQITLDRFLKKKRIIF